MQVASESVSNGASVDVATRRGLEESASEFQVLAKGGRANECTVKAIYLDHERLLENTKTIR